MVTLAELEQGSGSYSNKNNKVGTFESMLAGVGSGLIAIPKRFIFFRRKSYGLRCQQW